MVSLNDIQKISRCELKLSESLASHTSFGIGGSADYYLEPCNKDEFVRLVNYFSDKDFPFLILGSASSVLVSDQGFRGAVINLQTALASVFMEGPLVYAEAGVKIARLVDFCIHRSLSGMETMAGLPGTVGVAHALNTREIAEHLVDVEVLRGGELVRIPKRDVGSNSPTDVLVAARFSLTAGEKERLIRSRRECLVKRNQENPVNIPNAVRIFKDPPGHLAGTLIEEAGLKGLRHGGAMVSMNHANLMINNGNAKAHDVLVIIKSVQRAMRKKFNITLEPEITLIGFDQMVLREVA